MIPAEVLKDLAAYGPGYALAAGILVVLIYLIHRGFRFEVPPAPTVDTIKKRKP